MWVRLLVVGLLASCYSPHAQPGAPCSPATAVCPVGQTCSLVEGSYVCTIGAIADGAVDGPRNDARIDAPPGPSDARPDGVAAVPWTLVQSTASTTTAATIAASGSGHVLLVAVETNSTVAVASVTDNAGNAYSAIAGAHAINTAANLGVELWYARGSFAGATKITVSAPVVRAIVTWEIAGLRTTSPIDAVTRLDDQPASSLPTGAAITTTATGDFVVAVAIVANVSSGLHTGSEFTGDQTTLGNGWAHLTSASSPPGTHQATWDQAQSGASCAASIALFRN